MQQLALLGQVLGAVAARVDAGSDVSLATTWQRSVLALLALLAVGGAAGWVARQLARRSSPELIVLLNQSAAFYGRWPEDRLAGVPRAQLVAEASRCRRIIELLERRTTPVTGSGPADTGPIEGLRAWMALLSTRLDGRLDVPSGTAYA